MWTEQIVKLRLGHLPEMIGIGPIELGHVRVGRGDHQQSVVAKKTRDTGDGALLGGMVNVLDHFEACHQIERPRWETDPEIVIAADKTRGWRRGAFGAAHTRGRAIDIQAQ